MLAGSMPGEQLEGGHSGPSRYCHDPAPGSDATRSDATQNGRGVVGPDRQAGGGLDRARITHAAQRMDGALDLYRVLPAVANIRGILFRQARVKIFLSSNPLSLARSAPARGDKIPPDVAWTLRCRDAKKYRSHAARCPHDNPVARTKVEEPRPSKASPRY